MTPNSTRDEKECLGPSDEARFEEWWSRGLPWTGIEKGAAHDGYRAALESERRRTKGVVEALEYYAETENYRRPDRDREGMGGMSARTNFEIEDGEWRLDKKGEVDHYCYGKRARKALKEYAEG